MKWLRYALPLLVFAVLVGFLWKGLTLDPRAVPSPLIGKPAPTFTLPRLHAPAQTIGLGDFSGKVFLLNVWGSWCVSCRAEHPVLMRLAQSKAVTIIGLNWKDKPDEALAWLDQYGNPYQVSAADVDGRVGIDYGVYGAPETFVIDRAGVIRYKHVGALTDAVLRDVILPLIKSLQS